MRREDRYGVDRRIFLGYIQVIPERRKGFDRRVSFDPSCSERIDNKTDLSFFNSNRSKDYDRKTIKSRLISRMG